MSHTEDRLDEILEHYREYVAGVYQGVVDYDQLTAKQAILALIAESNQQARIEAVSPFADRLGRWLQPELMQMFVFEDMDRPMLLSTCQRYADWLLELDRLATLKKQKGTD